VLSYHQCPGFAGDEETIMINGYQLYELAQIREQEYMLEATVRRSRRRNRRQGAGLLATATRRLRRQTQLNED
jgi:hypothetical protein